MNADPDSYVDGNGQLYNMGFDLWCYEDGDAVFYDSLATDEQKKVWGSANSSTASFGKPTCVPDSVMVAVEGPGKYAVKLKTQQINALFVKKLAAGSIFTGTVFKLFYNAKGIINNFMRPASVNVYNRTNTTGIVLITRVI